MNNKHRILIVEDCSNIRLLLRRMFAGSGYEIVEAASGAAAMERLAVVEPDVILLDLVLPDLDGRELIPILNRRSAAAIVVVSARDSSEARISALDLGADDFIGKPFDVDELLARVRAALRRRISARGARWSIVIGDVEIDLVHRRVLKAGKAVHLTPREYAVVAELAKFQGRVISHDQLLGTVWDNDYDRHIEYLRVVIRSIRNKLEDNLLNPAIIINERGVGYRMLAPQRDQLALNAHY